MDPETIADRLGRLIDESGPIPVSTFVEEALYGSGGFYMVRGRAGRRGDFLTAPEVGPLFGAIVARAVDTWWRDLGRPSEFTVLEWGAGPGTLARSMLAAEPEAHTSGALRWVMVERSAAQRALHPTDDQLESVAPEDVPTVDAGLVVANELLDNLAFDIIEWDGRRWIDIRIDVDRESRRFVERTGSAVDLAQQDPGAVGDLPAPVPVGARLPRQQAARDWLAGALESIGRGRVVVFDYAGSTAELLARDGGWLRTHAHHDGRADWLADPGSCDITADVDIDQLQFERRADRHQLQAAWLARFGIDELVEEGRAIWEASAGIGDLTALKARSRIREAEALTDPRGMGAFHVLEWVVGAPNDGSTGDEE